VKAALLLMCVGAVVVGVLMWLGASPLTLPAVMPKADVGVDLPECDPLLQARFGRPDQVTGSGRMFLYYDLPNGSTLTLVVSSDKIVGGEHTPGQ
jgi:hypothetical protein